MLNRYDVVVVGGGIAGLAAALTSARAGLSVALFERARRYGGRARSREEGDFRLNLGPHAIFRGADRLLGELGVVLPGARPELRHAIRGGRVVRADVGGPPGQVRVIGRGAAEEAARCLHFLGTHDPAGLDRVPLESVLAEYSTTPAARQYTRAMIRLLTYVDAPQAQSAGAVAFHLQAGTSVRYLDGGWQAIVDGLRAAATGNGAIVASGRPVRAVEPRPSGEFLVRADDGQAAEARAVILAVGAEEASRLVPRSRALATWAAGLTPVRAACLDVALRGVPARARRFALGIDEPLYVSTHSRWAAGLAPEGSELVSVARYLPPGERTDAAADRRELERCLDLVRPGWRALSLGSWFLPSLAVANDLVSARRGGLSGRPGPSVPGLPGLFVAGDWVGPRGLLAQASLESAIAASELARALVKARATAKAV